jgi:hypothetical protein
VSRTRPSTWPTCSRIRVPESGGVVVDVVVFVCLFFFVFFFVFCGGHFGGVLGLGVFFVVGGGGGVLFFGFFCPFFIFSYKY